MMRNPKTFVFGMKNKRRITVQIEEFVCAEHFSHPPVTLTTCFAVITAYKVVSVSKKAQMIHSWNLINCWQVWQVEVGSKWYEY